jgi:hypothetical protein
VYWLVKPEVSPEDWTVLVEEGRGPQWEALPDGLCGVPGRDADRQGALAWPHDDSDSAAQASRQPSCWASQLTVESLPEDGRKTIAAERRCGYATTVGPRRAHERL